MRILALDGSMHKSGIAVFDGHKLSDTELVQVPNKVITEEAVVQMIGKLIERVRFYEPDIVVAEIQKPQHKGERMSTQALIHLAAVPLGVLGYASSIQKETYWFQPMSWKGNVPKAVIQKRIMENELKLKTRLYLYADGQSDIIDAIGIGRFWLERSKHRKEL